MPFETLIGPHHLIQLQMADQLKSMKHLCADGTEHLRLAPLSEQRKWMVENRGVFEHFGSQQQNTWKDLTA